MVKDAANVHKVHTFLENLPLGANVSLQFLDDLKAKLRPVGANDRETLLKLKEKEHTEKGYPFDGQFYIWDYRYFDQKFIQSSLDLDEKLVKEYFPVSVIVPQIIQIYQNLLSIKFVKMEGETWHPGNAFVVYPACTCRLCTPQRSSNIPSGRRTPRLEKISLDIVTWICSQGVRPDLLLNFPVPSLTALLPSCKVLARCSMGPDSWIHQTRWDKALPHCSHGR